MPPPSHQVTYHRNQRTLSVPRDQTLLRAGLDAGLRLDYSCQRGSCRTCMSRLLSGQVRQAGSGLSDQEQGAGFVLLCVATPRGDLELIEGSD